MPLDRIAEVGGRGAEDLEELRDALAKHFEVRLFATCREHDADACARDAIAEKPDLVIAAGGDGTIRSSPGCS